MNKQKQNYAWLIFIATCLISLIGYSLIINTVGLFYEPIGKSFNVSRTTVALMSTFQNIASAIVLLFAGKFMNKFGIKWSLTACFSIIGLCLISLSFAHSMIHFFIVWTIIGICQPFALLLSVPILLTNWFNRKLGTVMGFALGCSALGGAIFNPIISSIITSSGWRKGWLVEGLILLIVMIPTCLFIIKDKPNKSKNQFAYGSKEIEGKQNNNIVLSGFTFKEALKTPMLYLIIFAMIALQFVTGFVQHISAHTLNIGFSLSTGATVVSSVMLGAAIGKITIGYLLDRLNNLLVIIVYSLFGIIGWGGLIFANSSILLIISGLVLGLGQGILLVSLPYFIRKQFGLRDYSNILSIVNMFGAFACAFAISIDGMFFDKFNGYTIPLAINMLLYLLSGIALMVSIALSKSKNKKKLIN